MKFIEYNNSIEIKYYNLANFRKGEPSHLTMLETTSSPAQQEFFDKYINELTDTQKVFVKYLEDKFIESKSMNDESIKFKILGLIEKYENLISSKEISERIEYGTIVWPNPNLYHVLNMGKGGQQRVKYHEDRCEFLLVKINTVLNSINYVIKALKAIVTDQKPKNNKTTELSKYCFKLHKKSRTKYKQISTILRSQLIQDGYIEEIELTHFRSLFDSNSEQQYKRIKWLKPYNTLTFFIKSLQGWLIDDTIKQNVYEIGLKRFTDKNGHLFSPKRSRHDKDPVPLVKDGLSQIIESAKTTYFK